MTPFRNSLLGIQEQHYYCHDHSCKVTLVRLLLLAQWLKLIPLFILLCLLHLQLRLHIQTHTAMHNPRRRHILTVNVTVLALVVCAKAIAWDARIVVDATGAHKAEIVIRGVAHIGAAFVDVLVLGGHQWGNWQQIGCRFAGAKHHVANAADKRFGNIFNAMQLLLGREACEYEILN